MSLKILFLMVTAGIVIFVSPVCSNAKALGPFDGVIIDEITGEPVEGAEVFVTVHTVVGGLTPFDVKHEMPYLKSLVTKKDGRYDTGVITVPSGLKTGLDFISVFVYRYGYISYFADYHFGMYGNEWHNGFAERGFKLVLKRIPPNFDYSAEADRIDRNLEMLFAYEYGKEERRRLEKKVRWIYRRGSFDRQYFKYFTIKDGDPNNEPIDKDLIKKALLSGTYEEKMDALWSFSNAKKSKQNIYEDEELGALVADVLSYDTSDWRNEFILNEAWYGIFRTCERWCANPVLLEQVPKIMYSKRNDPMVKKSIRKMLVAWECKEVYEELMEDAVSADDELRFYSALGLKAILSMRSCFYSTPNNFYVMVDKYNGKYIKDGSREYLRAVSEPVLNVYRKLAADKSVNVRRGLLSNRIFQRESKQLVYDMLLDNDEGVRKEALAAVKASASSPYWQPYSDSIKVLVEYVITAEGPYSDRYDDIKLLEGVIKSTSNSSRVNKYDYPKYDNKEAVTVLLSYFDKARQAGRLPIIINMLSLFDDPKLIPYYKKALEYGVKQESLRALSITDTDEDLIPFFIELISSEDETIRSSAITALARSADERAFKHILKAAENTNDVFVIQSAFYTFGRYGAAHKEEVYGLIIKIFSQGNKGNNYLHACEYLVKFPDERFVGTLLKVFESFESVSAVRALAKYKDKRVLRLLIRVAKGEFNRDRLLFGDYDLMAEAVAGLGQIGDKEALPVVIALVRDKKGNERVRIAGIKALGLIGGSEVQPVLDELKNDNPSYLKSYIKNAEEELKKKK